LKHSKGDTIDVSFSRHGRYGKYDRYTMVRQLLPNSRTWD